MGDISLIINVFNVESESSAAVLSCFVSLVCTVFLMDCLSMCLVCLVFSSFHPQQGLPVLLIDFLI